MAQPDLPTGINILIPGSSSIRELKELDANAAREKRSVSAGISGAGRQAISLPLTAFEKPVPAESFFLFGCRLKLAV